MKADSGFPRGRLHQAHELPLGCRQRAVGHVVDKSDCQHAVADVAVTADFIGLPRVHWRQRGADDGPMSVELERHGKRSFRCFEPRMSRAGGTESLIDVFDDVADMFDADRKADGFGQDAGHALLLGRHLAMSGRGGVARKRLRVAYIDEPRDQLQRIIEGLAGLKAAIDAEREQRRCIAVKLFLDQRVVWALRKAGIVDPFDARIIAQEIGDLAGVLDMTFDAKRHGLDPLQQQERIER